MNTRPFKSALVVLGSVTILVLAANSIALATTGKALLMGKANSANTVTTVKRTTGGPALSIKTTTSAAAPLVVNGKGKVTNLNADSIDGLDSSALTTKPYVISKVLNTPAIGFTIEAAVPAGHYLVSYSVSAYTSPETGLGVLACYVTEVVDSNHVRTTAATTASVGAGLGAWTSGAGFATKAKASDRIQLECYGGAPFVSNSEAWPVQFVLTRVNGFSPLAATFGPAPE